MEPDDRRELPHIEAQPPRTRHVWAEVRSVIVGALVLVNAGGALYVSGLLWLLSIIHVDDGAAAHMSTLDWWVGGAVRLGISASVALGVGMVSYGVSWSASRLCGGLPRLGARQLAFASAGVAAVGGVIGAIPFVVTRPVF
jgi:hypothetical protein